jgi:hypothetical protein
MKPPDLPVTLAVLLLALPATSPAVLPTAAGADAAPLDLALAADDMLATGNEWLALPEIRASDGALQSFNVLSMRDRGLLQVAGDAGKAALSPTFAVNGKPAALGAWHWSLQGYWIPTARQRAQDIDYSLTWCAPPGQRAAFLRLAATNQGHAPAQVTLGLRASFGSLSRVTYLPVPLHGELRVGPAPWVAPGEAFSYVTDDTRFAWALVHPGAEAQVHEPPLAATPGADATRTLVLAPGERGEALFVLAAGVEEFSAAHNARALRERLDREGADAVIAQATEWALARTRSTGDKALDVLMNRNFLFTALYAWGRTIDTEQLVGVTSRSPRYYVSAAYWDRDAMLWSFPALLDIDHELAREALGYALGPQLRNAGTHSRFIDGVVLEDGFQLDQAAAPVLALGSYFKATGDSAFVAAQRDAIDVLERRLIGRFDAATGLYSSLQDAQDEYQRAPFITGDNVLVWRAFGELANLHEALHERPAAAAMRTRAASLRAAILAHMVNPAAPGASGPVFASATDGAAFVQTEIPPGSLMRLPALGFIDERDPLFQRTYEWLHSGNYRYSYSDRPYGLPGSYRLEFTPVWMIADELQLRRSHERALAILQASPWDAGIISEGIDPDTARVDHSGRAFATAAGYVAHALCASSCLPPKH